MAYKQNIQIRSCLFKLYLQVWLVSRTSVAREPCKCRSRAVQVSNKWIASVAHEGSKRLKKVFRKRASEGSFHPSHSR